MSFSEPHVPIMYTPGPLSLCDDAAHASSSLMKAAIRLRHRQQSRVDLENVTDRVLECSAWLVSVLGAMDSSWSMSRMHGALARALRRGDTAHHSCLCDIPGQTPWPQLSLSHRPLLTAPRLRAPQ